MTPTLIESGLEDRNRILEMEIHPPSKCCCWKWYLNLQHRTFKIYPLIFLRCKETCSSFGYYGVMGIKWCWCGNTEPSADRLVAEDECIQACQGDSSKKCGGAYRMNIYKNGKSVGT